MKIEYFVDWTWLSVTVKKFLQYNLYFSRKTFFSELKSCLPCVSDPKVQKSVYSITPPPPATQRSYYSNRSSQLCTDDCR